MLCSETRRKKLSVHRPYFPASQEPLLCPLDLRRRHPVWRPTALWLLLSFPGTLPSGRLSFHKNFAG